MYSKPKLLQGVFAFEGKGLTVTTPVDAALDYVPCRKASVRS